MSILDQAKRQQDDAAERAGIRWVLATADEQHLISAVLRDQDRNFQAYDEATLEVKESDFGSDGHRDIWRAISQTLRAHGTVSIALVAGWLDRKGKLERIGGKAKLYELAEVRANPSEARAYAIEIRQAAEMREVQRVGFFLSQGNATPAEQMARMREVLMKVETAWEDASMDISDVIDQSREKRQKRREEGLPAFDPTGLGYLDLLLGGQLKGTGAVVGGGLRMGTINFIGGPEKAGKTRLTTALCARMLFCHDAIVDWWSVEQLYEEILDFHVANISGLPTKALLDDQPPYNMPLDDFDDRRYQAEERLRTKSWKLHKPRRLVAEHIYHRAEVRMRTHREEIAKGRPYVVIVDYTQSVEVEKRTRGEREQIVEVCKVLRAIAKNLGAIVIPVFHTNRGPDDEEQAAHDVYGSSQLAKDADNLWLIWRPYRHHEKFKYFMRLSAGRTRGSEATYVDFRAMLSHCRYEEWDTQKHGCFESFHAEQLEAKKRGGRQ